MPQMTTAEAIVAGLIAHGLDTIYALPGVQNDLLFEALFKAGDRMRVVHTRHEQGAAYMALGANVIAYFAWFPLVRRLPAVVLGIGSMVTPCVGMLASAVIGGETIQPNDLLALALVCGALALVLFERPKLRQA